MEGKCKKCLGCNLCEDFGFKGKKKCKYYVKANDDSYIIALLIMILAFLILALVIIMCMTSVL